MNKTFALAAAAIAFLSTPALANTVPSATVQIIDLDLTKQSDQEKLDQRIDHAISKMCRVNGRGLQFRRQENACRVAAKADAAPKVKLAIAAANTEQFAVINLGANG